jgi:hypothetical protein
MGQCSAVRRGALALASATAPPYLAQLGSGHTKNLYLWYLMYMLAPENA